jgi:hypothetical protein
MPILFPVNRSFFRPKKRTGVKKFNYTLLIRDSLFLIMELGCLFIEDPCRKGPSERMIRSFHPVSKKRSLVEYQSPRPEKQSGGRSLQIFTDLT